jgi:hypothetical protein
VQNFLQQALAALGLTGGPGYPQPPGCGPALSGSLLDPANVAALPVSMQQSAVAVVPLLMTGADLSPLQALTPPAGYSLSVVPLGGAGSLLVISAGGGATPAPVPGPPAAC